MTSANAQLSKHLAEEEKSKKELQKASSELQAKLAAVQEERVALGQQLQLEREVHQKELHSMKAMMEDSSTKKDRDLQERLKLCRHERDEVRALLSEVKVRSTPLGPVLHRKPTATGLVMITFIMTLQYYLNK